MSDTTTIYGLPGMGYEGRCMTCDGRYCGPSCDARPGRVWVVGHGWKDPQDAAALEATGRTVYWTDRAERFLPEPVQA